MNIKAKPKLNNWWRVWRESSDGNVREIGDCQEVGVYLGAMTSQDEDSFVSVFATALGGENGVTFVEQVFLSAFKRFLKVRNFDYRWTSSA